MLINPIFENEEAFQRIDRVTLCACFDCQQRRSIEHINELIRKADKRLNEENRGLTEDWRD